MSGCPAGSLLVVLLLMIGAATTATKAEPAQRIISLNLCTDQILLDLVPRDRIAALSFLARDPIMSTSVEEARSFPSVRGSAEEVIALKPDLVLVGEYSTPITRGMLQRLGTRVVEVPLASTFDEIRMVIRLIASATGEEARGDELVRSFDARLAAAKATTSGKKPTVISYQVNSLASGPGSLLDEIVSTAGMRNLAAERKLGPGGRLPLEMLVLNPPDLIVFAHTPDNFRTVLGDNLRHPALAAITEKTPSINLPMPLWLCGTQRTVEAVERLTVARSRLLQSWSTP